MADVARGMAPQTFDDATRQNIVPLSSFAYSSGGTSVFTLPTSGLGARLWLQFAGTLTRTVAPQATPTGPFSIIQRISVRVNSGVTIIDCSGYALYLLALVNGFVLGAESGLETAPGVTAAAQQNAFNYSTATAGVVNFVLPVPLAWNHRDDIGLVLLQNQRAQVTVQINWAVVTGANAGADVTFPYMGGTVTSLTGTMTPYLEFFTLPDVQELFPDLLIMHKVQEFQQTPTATGDQPVTLLRGNTFTKIIHYLINAGVFDAVDIARMTLRYDQNVRPYEITWQAQQIRQLMMTRIWLPDGVMVWDLAWQGLAGLGYFRDTIDSEAVSELTSIMNINVTPSGTTFLKTVTDELLHLEPTA